MKRIVLALVFLCAVTGIVSAEQLTTVAVVDVAKVYTSFFRQSQAVRDLDNLKQKSQSELDGYMGQLRKLQDSKVAATSSGDKKTGLDLDKEIYDLQQFINQYKQLKTQQINDMQKNLSQSDAFMGELGDAIKYVAESNGFSVVIDRADPYLRFWSTEVDITDMVLDQLKKSVH